MSGLKYMNSCVNWPQHDVSAEGGLSDMVDQSRDVSRSTFLKYVDQTDLHELEAALGYTRSPKQGLTMADDYHVSYHRSKLHDETVYFLKHSAIEYVFA